MILITKQFKTHTAHRLSRHHGQCHNVHGHTYRYEVKLAGFVLPETGMLIDFSLLKNVLDPVIMAYDHQLLLNMKDPYLGGLKVLNVVEFEDEPTVENMVQRIAAEIAVALQEYTNVKLYSIRIWETETSSAEWVNY